MNKLLIIFLIIGFLFTDLVGQSSGFYRISFTDKSNSPYSVNNPQDFLSPRAIARRASQGISISVQDLPVNPSYIQGLAATGAQVVNKSKWFNSAIAIISTPTQYNQIAALSYVDTLEFVAPPMIKSSGPDKFEMEMMFEKPVMSPESQSKGLFDYGFADNQATMISVDYLHDLGYSGQNMHIAVIDAGFIGTNSSAVFDSVWNENRILGYKDFGEVGGDVFAAHTHGTMVFSIMGANIPGQMVGTAPHASYWLLRSEVGSFEYLVEEDNWVAAAEFADSAGVDIINSSLGYTEFYDPAQSHSYEDMDGNTTRVTQGADIAASKGILVVNSAGNSGASSWQYVGAPADGDSVFAIGAVDAFGGYASFSSQGPSYDGRVKPDVAAQGQGTTFGDPWGSISSGNGTSFSSPVMAGAAACLWQAFPSYSNIDIMNAIRQSASQYNTPDSLLGYGIPDLAAAATILGGIGSIQDRTIPQFELIRVNENAFVISIDGLNSKARLDVYDIMGRMVYSTDIGGLSGKRELEIPASDLQAGIYLLNLITANGSRKTLKAGLF